MPASWTSATELRKGMQAQIVRWAATHYPDAVVRVLRRWPSVPHLRALGQLFKAEGGRATLAFVYVQPAGQEAFGPTGTTPAARGSGLLKRDWALHVEVFRVSEEDATRSDEDNDASEDAWQDFVEALDADLNRDDNARIGRPPGTGAADPWSPVALDVSNKGAYCVHAHFASRWNNQPRSTR